jgi:hypothetical protein
VIDIYEEIASSVPDEYVGNVYADVLPPSITQKNYTAAAGFTAHDPVSNRTRWVLQNTLTQYALEHGLSETAKRAEESTEFSYKIHEASFDFADDSATIGRLPWWLLTKIDVPKLGESIGDLVYAPPAFAAGLDAAKRSFLFIPADPIAANRAFEVAYKAELSKRGKYELGGKLINWTIETTNSPGGWGALPWYGVPLRAALDALSIISYPLYD